MAWVYSIQLAPSNHARDHFLKSDGKSPSERYASMLAKMMKVKIVVLVSIQLSIEASRVAIYMNSRTPPEND